MTPPPDDLSDLLACPGCDALYREPAELTDARARCTRCGTVLIAPLPGAFARITSLAATAAVLMAAAVFFPFLTLDLGGAHNLTSVFDAVRAFSTGLMVPLSFAVAALIVLIPLLRLGAVLYTLLPLALGRPPLAHATHAFRLAQTLKPWSMAEIFIVGVAVALVKVAGLATVTLGPAFWAFAALVIVTALQDNFMCRHSVWKSLEQRRF